MKHIIDEINSHFHVLESSEIADIPKLAESFEGLDEAEIEEVLHAGKGALKRGIRVLIAYLGAAPDVYKNLGSSGFGQWLNLAKEVSKLSVSCCEGFFDSSLAIIEKDGLELLTNWTNTGIELSRQNKWIAIAYFKHTGQVIVSIESGRFQELVQKGSQLGRINAKVAEAYFEQLIRLNKLLTTEDFTLFCDLTKKVIKTHWLTAIELIELTEKILPSVPAQRRRELLSSVNTTLKSSEIPAMELFRNAATIMEKLDEKDFGYLTNIIIDLSGFDKETAKLFTKTIPQYIEKLDLREVEEWTNKGISSFQNNKNAAREFIPACLKLGNDSKDTDKETRSILVDHGISLADIRPDCLEAYFDNASTAYKMLTTEMFTEWTGTGEGIAIQSSDMACNYYNDSISALSNISPEKHEEIFRTANVLLTKEVVLTSVFIGNLSYFLDRQKPENIDKWVDIGLKVYEKDRTLALDFFANSPSILAKLDMAELESWTLQGLEAAEGKKPAGKAYFSLESKNSRELVEELTGAIALKKVANVLRYYALGLSGHNFAIRSMATLPLHVETHEVNPIIAGNSIYLAPRMGLYEDTEDNFKIYKLSVMHEVGHVRFSSLDAPLQRIIEFAEKLTTKYPQTNGYGSTTVNYQGNTLIDLADLLSLFPNQILAATIFGILEDARVEYMIMDHYKGVRTDLEDVQRKMLQMRTVSEDELERYMEALLCLSAGHEPTFEQDEVAKRILSEIQKELQNRIFKKDSSTFSSLKLAFDIYNMLEERFGPLEEIKYTMIQNIGYRGMDVGATGSTDPMMTKPYENVIKNFIPETETDLTADEQRPKEQATDRPSHPMDNNWRVLGSYKYDEWDASINDYRSEWSTINEIEPIGGTTGYYNKALERYGNEISLIKHTFSLMKPAAFRKMKEQNDGTEIDIDAFTESLIAKKCGINLDEGLYIRWDKHERDVATLFLMDVSASTRKILGSDGRSILDVEKDALIIMSQALESIGDKYAIYAFSGKSREAVEYFTIKDFDEKLSDNVTQRMSILGSESNTRLGPAIRHSITKLEKAGAKTKMLVLLSDGEPYDRSKGEDSYQGDIAQEDTRMAISEGKARGMHFFCITVDKNPGDYLDNIFSDVGYSIIDDALMLPEMLPLLYKRLTT